MLGDGRDEVAGLKDLEIAPDLGIEARAVDDRFPRGIGMHFIQREGVTDDVLGEAFEILTTGGGDPSLFREPLRRLDEARQTSDRINEILSDGVDRRLEQISASLATAGAQLAAAHPGQQLARVRQEISSLGDQLQRHILYRLEREQGRLARTRAALSALSPEATLARGFSITRNGEGKVITSSLEVTVGEKLRTQLAQGEIISEVKQIKSNPE